MNHFTRRWWRLVGSIALTFASLCAAPAAFAGADDVVFLKGGGRSRGFVFEESPTAGVRMKLADGTIVTYAAKDVDHVRYASGDKATAGAPSPSPPPTPAPALSPAAQPAVLAPAPAGEDTWAMAQRQALELQERRLKEKEEVREERKRKDQAEERAAEDAAQRRAPLRESWKLTLGIDAGFAAGAIPFGSLGLSGTSFTYAGTTPQEENVVGGIVDLAVGVRKGFHPNWEFVGAVSVGTVEVENLKDCGALGGANGGQCAGYVTASGTAYQLETNASLSPVLLSSLAVGLRAFPRANGSFFLGFGPNALVSWASGSVTTSFITYSSTTPPKDSASVNAVSAMFGGYLELGWWFGNADDWCISSRAAFDLSGQSGLIQTTLSLTKAFNLGGNPSEPAKPESLPRMD